MIRTAWRDYGNVLAFMRPAYRGSLRRAGVQMRMWKPRPRPWRRLRLTVGKKAQAVMLLRRAFKGGPTPSARLSRLRGRRRRRD